MAGPRVVFIPGIMGSMLRNPNIAKDINKQVLKKLAPFLVLLGAAGAILAREISKADLSYLWGRKEILFWMFVQDLWKTELLRGDGQYNGSGIQAPDLIRLPRVAPYDNFIKRLSNEKKADVLVFPYDWRLSNDVAAASLEAAILKKWWGGRDCFPEKIENGERVVIIAHSMGGLVARHFIEARNGYRAVCQLITAGTPHNGAPSAYTHFHGVTTPLGPVIDLNTVKALLSIVSPALPLAMAALPSRVHIPLPMSASMQQELMQSYSSSLQLLPTYDFVRLSGGRLEPISSTYGPTPAAFREMRHKKTGRTVPDVSDLMRRGMMPTSILDTWLGAKGVQYLLIASFNLDTIQGYDVPSSTPVRNLAGDGTVPQTSAAFVSGRNIQIERFAGVEHQKLFESTSVQDLCLRRLENCGQPTGLAEAPSFEVRYEVESAIQEIHA